MTKVLRLWAPASAESAVADENTAARGAADLAQGNPLTLLEYVEDCDVDAYDGVGIVMLTRDVKKARKFEDFESAMAFWKRQSKRRPLRPDGKPNRPLTAYNVTTEDV